MTKSMITKLIRTYETVHVDTLDTIHMSSITSRLCHVYFKIVPALCTHCLPVLSSFCLAIIALGPM
jgi:hypothetical protein